MHSLKKKKKEGRPPAKPKQQEKSRLWRRLWICKKVAAFSSTYHSMCQALAGHITYMVWPHPFNTSMRWLLFSILPLKFWSSLFKPEGSLLLHHQIFPSRGGWRATGEQRKDARWRQVRKSRLQLDKTIWSYEPEWKKTLVKHEKSSVQNK